MKEDITLKIMEGVELGLSNDDIAGIKQFFDNQSDYRAMRIARTETINAYGAGALEGYRQSGVVNGKYWMQMQKPVQFACRMQTPG